MSNLIIFDLGDVVMMDCRALREMARELGIDGDEFVRDYRRYNAALMDGWCSTKDYYKHLEIKYRVSIATELFTDGYNPKINKPMIDTIRALRSNGHRCVAGSNTFQCYTDWTEKNLPGFYDEFSSLYLSNEIHRCKPDRSFFEYILEKEHVDARSAYFIDDREENIIGARNLGINALLYDGDNSQVREFLKELF